MRLERVQQLTMRSSRECQAPLKLCNLYIMHLREMHYDMDNNAFAVECTKQLFFIAIQYQNKISCVGWVTQGFVKSVDLCKAQCVQYTIAHVWRGSPTVTLSKHGSRPRGFSGTLVAPWWLKPQWPLAQGNPQKALKFANYQQQDLCQAFFTEQTVDTLL